jgi:hypothetical protein
MELINIENHAKVHNAKKNSRKIEKKIKRLKIAKK